MKVSFFPAPIVSIILAVHNGESTLDAALASLHKQTWADFEVIVIDDASTDQTATILKKWQDRFSKQKFLIIPNHQNQGLTRSLLTGLSHIRGRYIARIDADDTWRPTKLAQQVNWLNEHPECGIVGSWYINKTRHSTNEIRLPTTDAQIRSRIFYQNPFGHSCIVVRKKLLEAAGSYDPTIRFGQDYDLWFRLLPLTQLANIPQFLVERNIEKSLSRRHSPEQLHQSLKTILKYTNRYQVPWWQYRGVLTVSILWRLSQLKQHVFSYCP